MSFTSSIPHPPHLPPHPPPAATCNFPRHLSAADRVLEEGKKYGLMKHSFGDWARLPGSRRAIVFRSFEFTLDSIAVEGRPIERGLGCSSLTPFTEICSGMERHYRSRSGRGIRLMDARCLRRNSCRARFQTALRAASVMGLNRLQLRADA